MISTCRHCHIEFEHRAYDRGLYCSAACVRSAKPNRIHGQSMSAEYICWREMKRRCQAPGNKDYGRYGARGIKVCDRWTEFANFFADMGFKPTPQHSLDRIDNDGDYEAGNCRWATRIEQSRNRRGSYTEEQDQQLRDAVARGLNFIQAAELIGKSHGSVVARAYRLRLRSGQPSYREHLND